MAVSLATLPRYLVLEPVSTVRFEVHVTGPGGGLDVELEAPKQGRSFLVLVGPEGGPFARRMRLQGRARIRFPRDGARDHVVMLANPEREPIVLALRGVALLGGSGGNPARPASPDRPVGARRPGRGGGVPVAPVPAGTSRGPRVASNGGPARMRGPPPKD